LGWGHSSYNYAIESAIKSDVKKLVFFHHDPNYNDGKLGSLEEQCKNDAMDKPGLEIIMAREGLKIEI
jgi:ribonuclease BN (tRNA processing enzyme)